MRKNYTLHLLQLLFAVIIILYCYNPADHSHSSNRISENTISKTVYQLETSAYTQKSAGLSKPLKNYLDMKQSIREYVFKLNRIKENHVCINVALLSKTIRTNLILYKYQVRKTFNYSNMPKNDLSEISYIVFVSVDSNSGLITDYYNPDHYYDVYMRTANSSFNSIISDHSAINARVKSLKLKIHSIYKNEMFARPVTSTIVTTGVKKSVALNRTKIKTWARNNYNRLNPISGNGSVPYYDFSDIPGNYDCTNFVSHALLAGGAKPYKPAGAKGISAVGWYYRNLNNRSSSWSQVGLLHKFLKNNKTKGPAGISSVYSSAVGTKGIGDILQIKINGIWMHSTIITRLTKTIDHRNQAMVTGRSGKGRYNDNVNVKIEYPSYPKRVIKRLVNYK